MSLIEANRPEVLSTAQTAYTATTNMMPAAIENRNEVFITDQGSSRLSRRRALRVRRVAVDLGFGPATGSGLPEAEAAPVPTAAPTLAGIGPAPPGRTAGGWVEPDALEGAPTRFCGAAAGAGWADPE